MVTGPAALTTASRAAVRMLTGSTLSSDLGVVTLTS